MKLFKKFIPCLLIVLCVFAITSCKSKPKYTYPSEVPTLSTEVANKTFMKIGNKVYTNGEVYGRLLQGYGLSTLKDMIDRSILNFELSAEDEKDFQEYLTKLKYGTTEVEDLTEEEKTEKEEQFLLNMASEGLLTKAEDSAKELYYENYYRNDYKRYVKALEVYKQEIVDANKKAEEDETDPFFKDADYVSYFTANYRKNYTLVVITFDSEIEAKDAMAKADVDLNSIAGEWKSASTGNAFDAAGLYEVYKNLYKAAYGVDYVETEYSYKDILALGTSVSSRVAQLSTETVAASHTHGPLANSSRFFLALATKVGSEYINVNDEETKFADSEEWIKEKDENNNVVELTDAAKERLFDEMVVNSMSSDQSKYANIIERVMFELRQEAGLEIFAESLEVGYKQAFNKVYSSLSITDYKPFYETPNTSKTVIAKTNTLEITVDDMFAALSDRYAALLGLLFVQDYIILTSKHNTVIDYTSFEVKDQTKYAEYVKEDLTSYKEAFEKGNFESKGYPVSYGWENFLRDYIGLTDEKTIVTDYNGSLYNDVLEAFKKDLYTATAEEVELVAKDVDGTKIWFLSVSKWNEINGYAAETEEPLSYNTGVAVVDENNKPTVKVAWAESDLNLTAEEIKTLTKNGYYGHFVLNYTTADGEAVCKVLPQTVDQVIYEEYNRIYDKSFSATAAGLYVYFDKDLDGVADEKTEGEAELAKELVEILWAKAKAKQAEDIESKLSDNLNAVVRDYYTSTLSSSYGKYKVAGVRIKVISGGSYSQSTNASEEVLDVVEAMYKDIVDYKNKKNDADETIGTAITGQNLETGYRYTLNNNVYYVTSYTFADKYAAFYADNGFYRLAVTKATAKTTKYVDESKQSYPSIYQYDQSLLDSDDREITISSAVSTRISTYYKPALNNLLSTNYVNRVIMTQAKDLLSQIEFSKDNAKHLAALTFIIEEAYDATELESK